MTFYRFYLHSNCCGLSLTYVFVVLVRLHPEMNCCLKHIIHLNQVFDLYSKRNCANNVLTIIIFIFNDTQILAVCALCALSPHIHPSAMKLW